MKLQTEYAVLGMVGTNCYFVCNKETNETIIIDPADNAADIKNWHTYHEKKPVAILLTHGHFDHMMAAGELRDAYDIPVYAAKAEEALLGNPMLNLSGKWTRTPATLKADHWLYGGETLELAGFAVEVIATPGHTAGGLSFYIKDEAVLYSGDTLFSGSYGRVDFPTSSMRDMVTSIQDKLLVLPEETAVYPGHGEATEIGIEKRYNPLSR